MRSGESARRDPRVNSRSATSAAPRRGWLIGIVGAVGAFGGFVVPQMFALSKASSISAVAPKGTIVPALYGIIALYLVMAFVAWFAYGRRGAGLGDAGQVGI